MKKKNKKKLKPLSLHVNCFECENAIYVGEGGYMCGQNNEIVIDDFEPTDEFYNCKGRRFVAK